MLRIAFDESDKRHIKRLLLKDLEIEKGADVTFCASITQIPQRWKDVG